MDMPRHASAFVATALAVALFHPTAARAGTAIWAGGATGDINDAANWSSTASTPKITADVAALTANASLPAGCSLKCENGILSVDVKSQEATVIRFR